MTPAERARQIDKQEFEAECAAYRKRALAMLRRRPKHDPRVQRWIDRGYEPSHERFNVTPVAPARMNPPPTARRPAATHEAFGKTQTLNEWAVEYGIETNTIRSRLKMGWTLAEAVSTPVKNMGRRAHKQAFHEAGLMDSAVTSPTPGVVSNFQALQGTGGGSVSQARNPEYNFSGIEA